MSLSLNQSTTLPGWSLFAVCLATALSIARAEDATEHAWHRYENSYFEAYSDAPSDEVMLLLRDLDSFRAAVKQFNGSHVPEDSGKTRIVIFSSREDYAAIIGESWVEAFTVGLDGIPHMVMWADTKSPWSRVTIRHEFVHVLQGYSGESLPPWYLEGLAEFLSAINFRRDGTEFEIGGTTQRHVSRKKLTDWRKLIAEDFRFDLAASDDEVSTAYFQAGLLARYIHLEAGSGQRGRIEEYLARCQSGEQSGEAFMAVFGQSVDDLGPQVYRQRRRVRPVVLELEPDWKDHGFTSSPAAIDDVRRITAELILARP